MLVVVAVAAVYVVYSVISQRRLADQAWAKAARRVGLRPGLGGVLRRRTMVGRHLGFPVRVWTFTKTAGETHQIDTGFEVRYPPLEVGMKLEHQGLVSKFARLLGGQDHIIGNPVFDDQVVIQGPHAGRLKRFLTPERQIRILRALESFPGLVIMTGSLSFRTRGTITSAARLESIVRRLCELARFLRQKPREDSTFERGLKAQGKGRLDEALDLVREAASRDECDADARVVEGEILLTSGRYDEAHRVLREAAEKEPDDLTIEGLLGVAEGLKASRPESRVRPKKIRKRPRKPVAPPPEPPEKSSPKPIPTLEESGFIAPDIESRPADREPPPADPAEESAPAELDLAALCEELFGADSRSFDTAKVFEEKYNGREVSGTGKLVRADSYYRDMVFGDGPGARATLIVHEVSQGPYGGREVQVVIQLPEGADDELRSHRDATFSFEGTLAGCDAFMRNLFVADGFVVKIS